MKDINKLVKDINKVINKPKLKKKTAKKKTVSGEKMWGYTTGIEEDMEEMIKTLEAWKIVE